MYQHLYSTDTFTLIKLIFKNYITEKDIYMIYVLMDNIYLSKNVVDIQTFSICPELKFYATF